jgi:hypothetical protein
VSDSERRNDVTTGASACNDYAHEINIRESNELLELRGIEIEFIVKS